MYTNTKQIKEITGRLKMSSSEFEIVESEAPTDGHLIISRPSSASSALNAEEEDDAISSENSDEEKCKEIKFDKTLEDKLLQYGLNRKNIKTIIHSIINDKAVKSLLQSSEDECGEVPEMRLTRSKLKESMENSFKAPWPLSPQKGHYVKPKPKFTGTIAQIAVFVFPYNKYFKIMGSQFILFKIIFFISLSSVILPDQKLLLLAQLRVRWKT